MTRNRTAHPEETKIYCFPSSWTRLPLSRALQNTQKAWLSSVVHICGSLPPGRHASRLPPLSSCLNLLVEIQDLDQFPSLLYSFVIDCWQGAKQDPQRRCVLTEGCLVAGTSSGLCWTKSSFLSTVQREHDSCPDSVEQIMLLPVAGGVGSAGEAIRVRNVGRCHFYSALPEWQMVNIRSGIQAWWQSKLWKN